MTYKEKQQSWELSRVWQYAGWGTLCDTEPIFLFTLRNTLQHNVIERDERPSPTFTMLTGLMARVFIETW